MRCVPKEERQIRRAVRKEIERHDREFVQPGQVSVLPDQSCPIRSHYNIGYGGTCKYCD